MYKWKKLGLIFDPTDRYDWMKTHATTPTPIVLKGNFYRVFFSTRNKINQNQTGYIDLDISKPNEILNISKTPVIKIGDLGTFDCDGIYLTTITKFENKLYGYYGGWNAGQRGLFYSKIGLAISEDNGLTFKKYSKAPILNIDHIDPLSVMAPFVIFNDGIWKMWYASAIKFFYERDQLKSYYTIKYATSLNGIDWFKSNEICLPLGIKDSNIARACILKEMSYYKSWYPVVDRLTGQYRIGYAESKDGVIFNRKDELSGISKSKVGWDSEAITYPYVIKHESELLMFYNGNNFGKEGFGLAKCMINE